MDMFKKVNRKFKCCNLFNIPCILKNIKMLSCVLWNLRKTFFFTFYEQRSGIKYMVCIY